MSTADKWVAAIVALSSLGAAAIIKSIWAERQGGSNDEKDNRSRSA
jgi:hypothetical protein